MSGKANNIEKEKMNLISDNHCLGFVKGYITSLSTTNPNKKVMLREPIFSRHLKSKYHLFDEMDEVCAPYIKEVVCSPNSDNNVLEIQVYATKLYRDENEKAIYHCSIDELPANEVAQILIAINQKNYFLVDKDFINNTYEVVSDKELVYKDGDIVNVISLANDFFESEEKEAELVDYAKTLLNANKGEKLVKFICQTWYGLNLRKLP